MIYADNHELWNTLKTLLGITDSDVMAFQLNIALDEIPTVTIARRLAASPEVRNVVQKYRIQPMGEPIETLVAVGGGLIDVTHMGSESKEMIAKGVPCPRCDGSGSWHDCGCGGDCGQCMDHSRDEDCDECDGTGFVPCQ